MVSWGCLGVSERCLGDDRVVSWCLGGVRWCLGGVLDTFLDLGTFGPPGTYRNPERRIIDSDSTSV